MGAHGERAEKRKTTLFLGRGRTAKRWVRVAPSIAILVNKTTSSGEAQPRNRPRPKQVSQHQDTRSPRTSKGSTKCASRAVHKYRAIGLAQTFRSAIPHDRPTPTPKEVCASPSLDGDIATFMNKTTSLSATTPPRPVRAAITWPSAIALGAESLAEKPRQGRPRVSAGGSAARHGGLSSTGSASTHGFSPWATLCRR